MLKRRLKEPFGKAGLTVAILALVLAMVGGAYAAGGLTKPQEKQVTKIAKKFAGKPGAVGPAGTPGANGTNGKNGTTGAPGPKGEEGSPWTAGGTLPSGQTETGSWGVYVKGEESGVLPVSFSIPLAAALDGGHVHPVTTQVQEGKTGGASGEFCAGKTATELTECEEEAAKIKAACPGTAANPQATSGNLCVYRGPFSNAGFALTTILRPGAVELGASTAGASLIWEETGTAVGPSLGTWAVTAP